MFAPEMRYLFLHPNFPSQHGPFASYLARQGNEVVFLTNTDRGGELEGVRKLIYKLAREPHKTTHPYLRGMESAVLHGQAALRIALALKEAGWIPDVVFGHAGWGSTLFMKDVFPGRPLLCNFEWFYHAHGTDSDFDPTEPLSIDTEALIRTKNTSLLLDLCHCDGGVVPLKWQHAQFPREFFPKLEVLHEGIDCASFVPSEGARLVLPRLGLDLSGASEVVTYVSRGFEPYRGFLQVAEALSIILRERPHAHVVLAGDDRSAYGRRPPGGTTWKKLALEKFPLDPERAHFVGLLNRGEYRQLLQASSAHIYLTRPFVLSWSLLEAMSAGCAVVASRTPPVEEVVGHGTNGLLADFFSPKEIAAAVCAVLANPSAYREIRESARKTILSRYDIRDLWPRRQKWMAGFAG